MGANKTAFALLLLLIAAACSYPTSSLKSVDTRPRIGITNASPTAVLIVNGILVGQAAAYDGEKAALAVSAGSNLVEVKDGDRVIYSQKIFLGEGTLRTINIPN